MADSVVQVVLKENNHIFQPDARYFFRVYLDSQHEHPDGSRNRWYTDVDPNDRRVEYRLMVQAGALAEEANELSRKPGRKPEKHDPQVVAGLAVQAFRGLMHDIEKHGRTAVATPAGDSQRTEGGS